MDESLHILIAEDDTNDALLLQRAFKREGAMRPPHIVPDGVEAISYLNEEGVYQDRVQYPFPNLIILDLKMPRKSGFDVLEWLGAHPDRKVIPTIIWSSSPDIRDVKRAYCLGANGYLVKPTSFDDFQKMVAHLLAFWQDCLKPPPDPLAPSCEELDRSRPFSGARAEPRS